MTAIEEFLRDNFHDAGYEIEAFKPKDWKPHTSLLLKIRDPRLRRFVSAVHLKWTNLTRIFNKSKLCAGCVVSSLNAPYPFVVPGGRFREFYYWDSYWIVEGLLISEMYETAFGHIMNMIEAVKVFGFVPNGFRVYYLNRSQPPLLVQIVNGYFERTGNFTFLQSVLPVLDQEYAFWMGHRTVSVREHTLNVYRVKTRQPRPESYKEDLEKAKTFYFTDNDDDDDDNDDESYANNYYANIASGAESGWDFTSRWLRNESLLESIDLWNIVPVDLNSILGENERILSLLHFKTGNQSMAQFYDLANRKRSLAIHEILWSEKDKSWYDFNLTSGKHSRSSSSSGGGGSGDNIHISNLSPLWFRLSHGIPSQGVLSVILERAQKALLSFPGGVPTSLVVSSSQQWDFPNSWAPLEYFLDKMYENLLKETTTTENQLLAGEIRKAHLHSVQRWIRATYCGWLRNGSFFEKYDVRHSGKSGFGGEYTVQDGFGWTNGVILYFLEKHGSWLQAPEICSTTDSSNAISKASFKIYHLPDHTVNLMALSLVILVVLFSSLGKRYLKYYLDHQIK